MPTLEAEFNLMPTVEAEFNLVPTVEAEFNLVPTVEAEFNLVLTVEAVFNLVNQVFSQTSSYWCNIFQVCIMSPLLLSSREGLPSLCFKIRIRGSILLVYLTVYQYFINKKKRKK